MTIDSVFLIETEAKVEKLKHMKLEVAQPKIKNKFELPGRELLHLPYVYYLRIGGGRVKTKEISSRKLGGRGLLDRGLHKGFTV